MNRYLRFAFCVLFAAVATVPRPMHADIVTDPADPLLMGGVIVPLPPVPVPPGAQALEFTDSGVTFRFESLSGQPIGGSGGILVFSFAGPGVLVSISPPVAAIAFRGRQLDGCPAGRFIGTLGIESTPPNCGLPVFGAGDIGAIGTVDLGFPGNVFVVTEMIFVPLPGGSDEADVSLVKTESRPVPGQVLNGDPLNYTLAADNGGPDTARDVRVVDFLAPALVVDSVSPGGAHVPGTNIVTWAAGDLPANQPAAFMLDGHANPDPRAFSCNARITNVATVSTLSGDPDLADNLSVVTTFYDNFAVNLDPEICGDGLDNNCDGRADCADNSCDCRPTLPPAAGGDPQCNSQIIAAPPEGPPIVVTTCNPVNNPAEGHACQVPRGRCGGVTLPSFCCDAGRLSDPSLENLMELRACDLGVPGCVPVDPNFKESDPPVNIAGFGYTSAGGLMTYTVHYENIGTADALDVKVIDVLDPNLDDATLVVEDGGTYDPATRAIVWTDPVVPPQEPRTVRFRANVRGDAPPGTHVRNVGTIVFPNAVPPSRIDTEPLEHVVPDPAFPIVPRFRIRGCEPAGGNTFRVALVNEGVGFGYNVTAAVVGASPAVTLLDGDAAFSHPDDPNPAVLATVIPNATTTSGDVIAFDTAADLAAACATFDWQIRWENLRGEAFTVDLAGAPDGDDDAVPDAIDNCPAAFNPDQADADADGTGDACENQAPVCDGAAAAPGAIWPPDHRFVPVGVGGVADPDGDDLTIVVSGVRQDEPLNAAGDGHTSPDAMIENGAVLVRAERSGRGNGRVYHIAFTADDGKGGACAGEVTVCVPHDRGPEATCVDEGPLFESAAPIR